VKPNGRQIRKDGMNRRADLGEHVMALDPSHDFDFLIRSWNVRHRRLKERLAGKTECVKFDGTCKMQPIPGGAGNVDDNVLNAPPGVYRASKTG